MPEDELVQVIITIRLGFGFGIDVVDPTLIARGELVDVTLLFIRLSAHC